MIIFRKMVVAGYNLIKAHKTHDGVKKAPVKIHSVT